MSEVVVVGSLSMDLTARANRLPGLGETLIGYDFTMVPGGKGNNQAITSARQGVDTSLVGCIGNDQFGDDLLDFLENDGVDVSSMTRVAAAGTGIAHITVDGSGDNAIVIIPRANSAMSAERVRQHQPLISSARVVLTQLEIPIEAAHEALLAAREDRALTILNPAPAQDLDTDILRLVDICVPNEVEAFQLTDIPVTDRSSAIEAAHMLQGRGCVSVIVTLGAQGAIYVGPDTTIDVPPFDVAAVDSVAAGDAFCGALAAAMARGAALTDALRRSAAAGALAVAVPGATPSLPTADAVTELIEGAGAPIRTPDVL